METSSWPIFLPNIHLFWFVYVVFRSGVRRERLDIYYLYCNIELVLLEVIKMEEEKLKNLEKRLKKMIQELDGKINSMKLPEKERQRLLEVSREAKEVLDGDEYYKDLELRRGKELRLEKKLKKSKGKTTIALSQNSMFS